MSDWEEGKRAVSLGTVAVMSETAMALEVSDDEGTFWVPKSVIHDDSEIWAVNQLPGELVVEAWWAVRGDRKRKPHPTPDDDWEAL